MNQKLSLTKENRIKIATTIFSIFSVILYPCLFMYFLNADKVKLHDILGLIGLFSLNAAIVFGIAFLYYRNLIKAGLLTNVVMIFILLFGWIEKAIIAIIPMLYYWHIVMILLSVAIFTGIIIKTKTTTELTHNINTVLLTVFAGLIIFNGIQATPTIIKKINDSPVAAKQEIQKGTLKTNSNVYYYIFDEYGGLDNLKRYTGYDNSPFYDSLEKLGFNVSKSSRNYTINSDIEIPNLLNLDLANNETMTHETRIKAVENPYLFQLFKENGYQLNIMVDNVDFSYMPIRSSDADYEYSSSTASNGEDSLQTLIINNSVYYPLLTRTKTKRIEEVDKMFQYIQESTSKQSENLFSFGYFMFPHLPWVVDEFGNSINGADRDDYRKSDVYLGQMKYASKKILEAVQKIIEADPDAIIIIQSDHGYRQPTQLNNLFGNYYSDMDLEMKFQRNNLNAVYYKGENLDITSLSGVNTLITVLNKHFGMDIKLMEPSD